VNSEKNTLSKEVEKILKIIEPLVKEFTLREVVEKKKLIV